MSCARIRNKPMKFLDPQEKLILDLKEEIRRLRNENKKLRSNLLTAPSSGEKARLSEDEDSSVMSRAYSAHSSLEKERIKFKPRNGGKMYGTKMHGSKSDFIRKLSPLKGHKSSNRPPKREMTKDEALQMLDDMRAANLAKQFAGSRLEQDGMQEDGTGDEGSLGSASKASRMELEDVVRRRASGPMVFRGDSMSNISPVRQAALQSGYAPAQNKERNLDALRIEELEKRIARMESGVLAAQRPFPHDHHTGLPGAQSMPLAAAGHESNPAHGAGAATGKRKKKKKAGKPEEAPPVVWKGKMTNSPYVAHLISAAPKAAQDGAFGVRVVSADKEVTLPAKPRPVPAEAAPAPRPAGRTSADNLRAAVAAASDDVSSPEPAKDLRSSILDELAELGLGPVAPTVDKKATKPAAKMTTKAGDKDRAGSHSRARAGGKPVAPLLAMPPPVLDSAKPAKVVSKLPPAKKPAALPPMQSRAPGKLAVADKSNPRASSATSAKTVANGDAATPLKKAGTASDPAALRAKLETLEKSLAEEREVGSPAVFCLCMPVLPHITAA
jgi:cell division septum initiation protein DivIVA